ALGWAASAVWATALAGSFGLRAFTAVPERGSEYRAVLPAVGDDPIGFLDSFAGTLRASPEAFPIHVRAHPPLPVLLFWAVRQVGLSGPYWAAAVIIAVGTAAVPAIMITARSLAGEDTARRAFPHLTLAPALVFVAVSSDALFLGISAWGVALLALAVCQQSAARAAGLGVASGLAWGALPYLSYGLLPLGALAVAVLLARPAGSRVAAAARLPILGAAALAAMLAAAMVAVAFTAAGFWWFDGLAATHQAWAAGEGSDRPYVYFLVASLATLALLVGPGGAAGLARLREPRLWSLVGAALLGILALDLSGFTRGEVERIWLPFAFWVVLAAAALRPVRLWLGAQVATGLVVEAVVWSAW
ncbi:MAG: hypothetical protein ACRDPK_12135, partial [Carbonactinosporaceae bacterium]